MTRNAYQYALPEAEMARFYRRDLAPVGLVVAIALNLGLWLGIGSTVWMLFHH